jgi:hypothetical protein
MYVGITSAGNFRADDGGDTWMPLNKNVAADFLPDPYTDVGHCVHKLLLPCVQAHGGTSATNGESWGRVHQ